MFTHDVPLDAPDAAHVGNDEQVATELVLHAYKYLFRVVTLPLGST